MIILIDYQENAHFSFASRHNPSNLETLRLSGKCLFNLSTQFCIH